MMSQSDLKRLRLLGKDINISFCHGTTADFCHELRGSLTGPFHHAHISAAFEPIARIRMETGILGCGANVFRAKIRRLQQHITGILFDLSVKAAHHTGKRNALFRISNQEII